MGEFVIFVIKFAAKVFRFSVANIGMYISIFIYNLKH